MVSGENQFKKNPAFICILYPFFIYNYFGLILSILFVAFVITVHEVTQSWHAAVPGAANKQTRLSD